MVSETQFSVMIALTINVNKINKTVNAERKAREKKNSSSTGGIQLYIEIT